MFYLYRIFCGFFVWRITQNFLLPYFHHKLIWIFCYCFRYGLLARAAISDRDRLPDSRCSRIGSQGHHPLHHVQRHPLCVFKSCWKPADGGRAGRSVRAQWLVPRGGRARRAARGAPRSQRNRAPQEHLPGGGHRPARHAHRRARRALLNGPTNKPTFGLTLDYSRIETFHNPSHQRYAHLDFLICRIPSKQNGVDCQFDGHHVIEFETSLP